MDWSDNATVAALVGAAAAALLTAIGYPVGRWLQRDRSDLVFTLQELRQAVPLVGAHPRIDGETVYCQSLRLLLVLSHNGRGDRSVLVHRVGMEVDSVGGVAAAGGLDYEVDVLRLRPHGIVDIRRYEIGISPDDLRGRFIAALGPAGVDEIDPHNFLERPDRLEAISIGPSEAQISLATVVQADRSGLYRVRFQAGYTVRGDERRAQTDWIHLYRKP